MDVLDEEVLQQEVADFLDCHAGGERIVVFSAVPVVLIGISHLILESIVFHNTHDRTFVILLCIASIFLSVGILFVRTILCESAVVLYQGSLTTGESQNRPSRAQRATWRYRVRTWRVGVNSAGELLSLVFDRRAMLICGLAYGVLLGSAPAILGLHQGKWLLRSSLMLFMFAANLVTGAALYSLVMTLRQSWHLAKRLDITFFLRTTKAVIRYTRLLAAISLIGAIYIGTCQLGAVFSDFGGLWIAGYALFAIALYLCMYYVPQWPIRRRLSHQRDELLARVNAAKADILNKQLTQDGLDALIKIYDTEDRIIKMGLGLPGVNESFVELAAIIAGGIPLVTALLEAYVIRSH